MIRHVGFNQDGDIVVLHALYREDIKSGVVMLTTEQAAEAAQYGWREVPSHPDDIEHGLRRVAR